MADHPFLTKPEGQSHVHSWLRFGILPPEEKLDIAKAKTFLEVRVLAQRSDKEVFYAPVIILDPEEAAKHPAKEIMLGTLEPFQKAFAYLETFRDCDCLPRHNITCNKHRKSEPN